MALDLTPFINAIGRLDVALTRYGRDTADEEVRDSVVQRFEFTYDLAAKMLRRVLEASADTPGVVQRMTFPTLIRTAFEQGLVAGGWPAWHEFREMRNITSHTYDATKAMEVVNKVPAFLEEARFVAERLTHRVG